MNTKIESVYATLSKSDKAIADYFLSHGKDIISMNIHELAAEIGTSSASVSRFVRKVLGKSFAETKIELAKNIESLSVENTHEIFEWVSDFDDMPNKIISHIDQVCKDVLDFNGIKVFEEVITLLADAENIFLFGVGSSGIVAQDMHQKMIKLRKRALYITDSNFGTLNAALCTDKDVVVAISFSGRTKEVNIAARKAKEMGAKVISITNNTKNKLRALSDINIVIPSVEMNESRLAAIFSRYGQLFVVDMLFVGLAKRISNSPSQLLDGYREILKELKENR